MTCERGEGHPVGRETGTGKTVRAARRDYLQGMNQERIISMLASADGFLSGEEMSRTLGVTRAAVWKEIAALREKGWNVESVPSQGYRLRGNPPGLSGSFISARLKRDSLFFGKIQAEDSVNSTNTRLKTMAAQGAPEGTVLLAEEQTGGRGTRGRTFCSPRGEGLYLSVLLRPKVNVTDLFSLTGWSAVAVREGIEAACGAPAEIKWLNDIYLGGKKLVGILTEMSLLGESSEPDYVVIGIGVNVSQTAETFRNQGLEKIATSLKMENYDAERNHLAVCILSALERMYRAFPCQMEEYLNSFRSHCITLGREVLFEENGATLSGQAREVDNHFLLRIAGDDGADHLVSSGTVSLKDSPRMTD